MVEEKAMNKEKAAFIAKIAVPLVIALVSFFFGRRLGFDGEIPRRHDQRTG